MAAGDKNHEDLGEIVLNPEIWVGTGPIKNEDVEFILEGITHMPAKSIGQLARSKLDKIPAKIVGKIVLELVKGFSAEIVGNFVKEMCTHFTDEIIGRLVKGRAIARLKSR